MYNPQMTYNDLPILPPKENIETASVLKKTISANKALAELKGWTFSQPNPFLLLNSLILQEAKSSSAIENIVTTNDELYKAFASPDNKQISSSTKEVLHYKEALMYGYNKISENYPLVTNIFVELFRIIKQRSDGIRSLPGTVLLNNKSKVIYTRPANKNDTLRLLSNLEKYINLDDDVDPLIKLAVIHYQFECIHPFPDGNGRVGRIINVLYLIKEKLLIFPILYISRYIITNKSAYYKNLKNVTENNDWESWILYILDAIETTAKETLSMVKKIYGCQNELVEFLKKNAPSVYSRELIELLFEHPYCKIAFLINKGIAKKQTASRYLNCLQRLGVLDIVKSGRENYYINRPLWAILTSD